MKLSGFSFKHINKACKKTHVPDKKCSNSRHAKSEKCEFTPVNDSFKNKNNAVFGLSLHALNNDCKKTPVLDKKCSNSRHAKSEKCEFTPVNDHFEDEHNAVFGLFLQRLNSAILCSVIVLGLTTSCSKAPEIIVQEMQMELPDGLMYFSEELLPGEIADTKIEHFAFVGPVVKNVYFSDEDVDMLVFIKGDGQLTADTLVFNLVPESIAIPMAYQNVRIEVPQGEVLHFVRFSKKLSEQDLLDMAAFPAENKYDIFFTRFDDCEPYTEKIKSPNTVSRTVLPADIIPRVSLGTVEAPGPDEVGAHEHGMLDQLFLGLSDNDIVVHADGASAQLKAYSLLHIPLGSSHGVTVGENKMMYYLWMDFFLTKDGQEWLKTHKPVTGDKKDY